jgi:exopolyphosphatase / guanosine-5'-triphosphate,3'-diphosphate pyrophosphatase
MSEHSEGGEGVGVLSVVVDAEQCTFALADRSYVVPVGPAALNRSDLVGDPPSAAQLTNAIGAVQDHLDDVVRELPGATDVEEVRVIGAEPRAIAFVEAGREVELPFDLTREAAEDVFRTVATERRSDRARNPGLPPEAVDTVVAGCCVLVAVMRRLHLDAITVAAGPAAPAPIRHGG